MHNAPLPSIAPTGACPPETIEVMIPSSTTTVAFSTSEYGSTAVTLVIAMLAPFEIFVIVLLLQVWQVFVVVNLRNSRPHVAKQQLGSQVVPLLQCREIPLVQQLPGGSVCQ